MSLHMRSVARAPLLLHNGRTNCNQPPEGLSVEQGLPLPSGRLMSAMSGSSLTHEMFGRATLARRPAAIRSVRGVWTSPGATAFTRIPWVANCSAADFVRPDTPCLLATLTVLVAPTVLYQREPCGCKHRVKPKVCEPSPRRVANPGSATTDS